MRGQNSRACCAGATECPPFLSTEMWTCAPLDDRVHPVAPVGPRHGDPQLCFNETSAKPLTVARDVGVLYSTRELAAATRPRLAHADLIDWRE